MRKSTNILLTLVFVFASMGVFAQKGLIDIKKLQDREYYPTSVLVKYVNDKGSYAYTETGRELVMVNAKGKTTTLDLQTVGEELGSFASIDFLSDDQFAFLNRERTAIFHYNIKTKQLDKVSTLKEG